MKLTYTRAEATAAMDLIKAICKEKGTLNSKQIIDLTLDDLVRQDEDVKWNAAGELEMTIPEEKYLKIVAVLRKHVVPMTGLFMALEGIAKSFKYIFNNMRDDLKALGL